ncbi:cellulose binding domain-containing protein, partial [Kibdelosporangium lantanae]
DLDQAIAFNETARETAERIGSVGTTGMYYAFLNQLALLRGTLDRTSAEAALVQLRQVPDIALVRIFVPMTHALTGDVEAAKATFEEFRHMPPTLQIGPRWGALIMMIGVVAVLLDDAETAALVYDSVRDLEPDYMTDGTGAAQRFTYGPANLGAIVRGGDLQVSNGHVDATYPANSITLLVLPAAGCTASLHVNGDWNTGHVATVTVTNDRRTAMTGWRVSWTWSGNQQVTNSWNTVLTQNGTSVVAADAGWNGPIGVNGNTSFGFQVIAGEGV